jgi:hypothetical protein
MEKDNLEMILEDIKEKFDLVLEGHQTLRHDIHDLRQEMNEKFETVDFKIETLNKKIDNVAADLAAHRADTESHPKGYKVSDGK